MKKYIPLISLVTIALIAYFGLFTDTVKENCTVPVTFKIAGIDKKFNLSTSTAIEYATQAGNLWNKGSGKDLLKYDELGEVEIYFVYDQRQAQTIQENILKEKIANQKVDLRQTGSTINSKEAIFNQQKKEYEQKSQELKQILDTYNAKIDEVNRNGGATPEQGRVLDKEKAQLDAKIEELDRERLVINNYLDSINNDVETFNSKVKTVNKIVNQANKNTGSEFEEGNYQNKKIVLYQYEDAMDLKRLLAHELGHALGFDHVDDSKSIMYYLNYGNKFLLGKGDIEEFKKVCNLTQNS